MNGITKKIIGTTSFIMIFVLLLIISSFIFMPKNNLAKFGMTDTAANGILGEKANTIDVLVIGDSEAYSSIIPMEIWKTYGFTTYVCATSAQYLSYSETLLKQAFQKQKPRLVILESNAIYREIKFENSIMTKLENVFSVFKYHDRWKSITPNDFTASAEYTWTDDFKGYYYSGNVLKANPHNYMKKTDETESVSAINKTYVKNIADYCEKNSANFMIVSTPSSKNWDYKKHNGISELAKEYQIDYIDLNLYTTEVPIDWSKDTRDGGDHLNHSGAIKTTNFLGKYFKEKYSLPDNRNDKAYSKWNEAYERYLKKQIGKY